MPTHLQPIPTQQSKVHVIVPAFNEAENIIAVVQELLAHRRANKRVVDTVIVCDNASTDGTAELARHAGAHVVHEARQGYGAACLCAIKELRTCGASLNDTVVFVDGDHSVKTEDIDALLLALSHARGLVIGARKPELSQFGAMSPHQRIGNVVASFMIRLLWAVNVSDLGPFRALSYRDLVKLNMQDQRFGWTTEMQVKAIQQGLAYSEIDVSLLTRQGKSKISGTLTGTVGAAYGIFSTVFRLWLQERLSPSHNHAAQKRTTPKL